MRQRESFTDICASHTLLLPFPSALTGTHSSRRCLRTHTQKHTQRNHPQSRDTHVRFTCPYLTHWHALASTHGSTSFQRTHTHTHSATARTTTGDETLGRSLHGHIGYGSTVYFFCLAARFSTTVHQDRSERVFSCQQSMQIPMDPKQRHTTPKREPRATELRKRMSLTGESESARLLFPHFTRTANGARALTLSRSPVLARAAHARTDSKNGRSLSHVR